MSNDGGVPGQGGQDPQESPYGPPSPGGRPEQPHEQLNPYGQQPVQPGPGAADPDPYRQQPRYGQYAPPGYEFPAPVPSGQWAPPPAPPSVGQSHGFAWRSFGRNAGLWILWSLLFAVIAGGGFLLLNPWYPELISDAFEAASTGDSSASLQMSDEIEEQASSPAFLLTNSAFSLIMSVIGMTFYAGALASTRKQRIGFGDLFALRNWGGILLLALVTSVVSFVVGLIPFAAGFLQIVIGLLFVAAPYFVLDKGMNGIQAIGESVKLVTSNLGITVLGYLIVVAYTFAGACLCGLGLPAVFPFAAIFGAHLFRRLQDEPIEADQAVPPAY